MEAALMLPLRRSQQLLPPSSITDSLSAFRARAPIALSPKRSARIVCCSASLLSASTAAVSNGRPDGEQRENPLGLPSKGRAADDALGLFTDCLSSVKLVNPRQYVAENPQLSNSQVWFQRPMDIVRKYLSGDLDIGVVGFDTVSEYGQVALVPVHTGMPDFSPTQQALKEFGLRGPDIIELRDLYSNPLADCPVIQAASTQFLGGFTELIAFESKLKEVALELISPIALFPYYDQFLKLGVEKFMSIINDAGIHGQRPPWAYNVFISYKRDDKLHPVSHLNSALERKEIVTFVDFALDRGVDFWPATEKAIEQSEIAVVVVSQNFHLSPWCLNELVKILECRKKRGLMVLPIFWGIAAKELREQSRLFVENIGQGEKGFKQKPHQVQIWRDALRALGLTNGWSVSNSPDKTEAEVIEDLADKISAKLNRSV